MGVDSVTVFGLGLIVGGLGLLATAAVGLGHRYRLFDGRRSNRPRPGRAAVARSGARPRGPAPNSVPARDIRDSDAPPRAVPGGMRAGRRPAPPGSPVNARADLQGRRPRDGNQPRRPIPPITASALLADTLLLQPMPAWSEPAPHQHRDEKPPPGPQ